MNVDGSGLERITYYPGFDAFPMFSADGKKMVWASNRNGRAEHETNIFIAGNFYIYLFSDITGGHILDLGIVFEGIHSTSDFGYWNII